MADWRATVDKELDALRAKQTALQQMGGNRAEIKQIEKRKADLKMLKKKGIKMGDTKRITSGDSASSNTKNTRVYKGIRVNQKEMQSGDNDCSEDSNDITDDLDA